MANAIYNPKSLKAEEFIHDGEIRETLAYAEANKRNVELIDQILDKARPQKTDTGYVCAGLSHREASVLLACDIPEKIQEIYKIAEEIKLAFYGNRIVMFAPLYLSNYCVNGCVYCPYHLKNKQIPRKKLTQEEVRAEVIALQDMGHKRLAIEAGEDPKNNPIEYILECIKTIYSVHHKNGDIRRVNVNIAATTVENYRKLKEAGIGTYILFQETYHKESYLQLHPTGPKHDYDYHTEAMDRAMEGGIDDVGLGVLFGLGAALFYATVILLNKFIKGVTGIHRTFLQFLAAIAVLIPYVLCTGGMHPEILSSTGWICLLVVGLVHTGITYCMYFSSLKELPGQEAAILSYVDPLVAVVIGVVLLKEPLSWQQLVGGLLILGFTLWNELDT